MKRLVLFFGLSFFSISIFALDLGLTIDDVRIEKNEKDSGVHLYVRKKPQIRSVMLTESTKDETGTENNYAYRDTKWNEINGDEIRILNSLVLDSDKAKYSIIDSTPEPDKQFGNAYHLYIPEEMVYGYEWGRNGKQKLEKGLFINIRTFEKFFGNYEGSFEDNPFLVDISPEKDTGKVVTTLSNAYRPETVESFSKIAGFGGGNTFFSESAEKLVENIEKTFEQPEDNNDTLDFVVVIDATASMKDDIDAIERKLKNVLSEYLPKFSSARVGLVAYKDYGYSYNENKLPIKTFPFTESVDEFMDYFRSINIKTGDGGDVPEAVYEGLYGGLTNFPWNPQAKQRILLIGDAEPHPTPRGSGLYSAEYIKKLIAEKGIKTDVIILNDPSRTK